MTASDNIAAPDRTTLSPAAALRLIAIVVAALVLLLAGLVLTFGAPGLGIFGLIATVVVFAVMLAFTAGN